MKTQVTDLPALTKHMINERPASLSLCDLCQAIGRTPAWLRLFRDGKLKDPGFYTMCKIIEIIENHKGV